MAHTLNVTGGIQLPRVLWAWSFTVGSASIHCSSSAKANAERAAPTANQRGVSAFRKKCMDKIHVKTLTSPENS